MHSQMLIQKKHHKAKVTVSTGLCKTGQLLQRGNCWALYSHQFFWIGSYLNYFLETSSNIGIDVELLIRLALLTPSYKSESPQLYQLVTHNWFITYFLKAKPRKLTKLIAPNIWLIFEETEKTLSLLDSINVLL